MKEQRSDFKAISLLSYFRYIYIWKESSGTGRQRGQTQQALSLHVLHGMASSSCSPLSASLLIACLGNLNDSRNASCRQTWQNYRSACTSSLSPEFTSISSDSIFILLTLSVHLRSEVGDSPAPSTHTHKHVCTHTHSHRPSRL